MTGDQNRNQKGNFLSPALGSWEDCPEQKVGTFSWTRPGCPPREETNSKETTVRLSPPKKAAPWCFCASFVARIVSSLRIRTLKNKGFEGPQTLVNYRVFDPWPWRVPSDA